MEKRDQINTLYRIAFLLYCLLLLTTLRAKAQTYVFAQLKGSPMNTTGWTLQGDAKVTNIVGTGDSELLLCRDTNWSSGAAFFNQAINLAMCNTWKAEFDLRMYDGTGADGVAFCFLDVPPAGFVNAAGLGIPGTANGLKVCFDTYNNCDSTNHTFEVPKVEIRWGEGYNECWAQPTAPNINGQLSFIRAGAYVHVVVSYSNGVISVTANGLAVITTFQQFNFTGYLGFTASTGGENDNESIKNVAVYTQMPPSVAGSSHPVCPGDTVHLGTANDTAYRYSWSPAAGLSSTTVSNPYVVAVNNTSTTGYQQYFVKTSFDTIPGCASEDSILIQVNPNPVAGFGAPLACLGVAGLFTDSATIGDGTQAQLTYQWLFGDGSTGTGSQPTHAYAAAGNYTAEQIVTSNNGCKDSISKTFAISAYPVADFSVLTTNFCGNLPLQIKDNSSVAYATLDSEKIFWNYPAGQDSTLVYNPATGAVYTHNYPTFGYTGSQQVTVALLAFSSAGCYTQQTGNSILFASPKLVFDSLPNFCANNTQPVLLNEAKDTTVFAGTGFYVGPGVSNGYFTPGGTGTYTITYTYTLANGCTSSIQQTATVYTPPAASAGAAQFILQGSQTVLQGTAIGDGVLSYVWSPGASLNDSTVPKPIAKPSQDTWYTLKAANVHGCWDTAGVLVKVLKYPVAPNAFSPNGDGINDTWQIAYLSAYPDCVVQIFNRYGQVIFRSQGYQTPWDGTYNGKPMPVATYYYIITSSQLPQPVSGFVTLLR